MSAFFYFSSESAIQKGQYVNFQKENALITLFRENTALCETMNVISLLIQNAQEMDCIVDQMMNVAEYLGWDVSELKPVSMARTRVIQNS